MTNFQSVKCALILAAVWGISLFYSPVSVFAQAGNTPPTGSSGNTSYELPNPLRPEISSVSKFVELVLQAVITIGTPVAALFIVYAGFKFVIARGNPGELENAKKNLLYTFIGIALFLGAWLIAKVIHNTILQLPGSNPLG